MAHVPEGRHVFSGMTVEENLEMGAYIHSNKEQLRTDMKEVYERFPRLKERCKQLSGTLSGGEQQMLAVGRALILSKKCINRVLRFCWSNKMALSIADRAYVLETGRIKMSGDAKELLANDDVRKAYLGV